MADEHEGGGESGDHPSGASGPVDQHAPIAAALDEIEGALDEVAAALASMP